MDNGELDLIDEHFDEFDSSRSWIAAEIAGAGLDPRRRGVGAPGREWAEDL